MFLIRRYEREIKKVYAMENDDFPRYRSTGKFVFFTNKGKT